MSPQANATFAYNYGYGFTPRKEKRSNTSLSSEEEPVMEKAPTTTKSVSADKCQPTGDETAVTEDETSDVTSSSTRSETSSS
eukprot:CAMPEP_0198128360 /NCGR_PEP_ID=MMETSP1442-20131203/49163_1 /TAXON_ID= /ORGANISM="Craspedostauros australis, Strain CCMP3328" /LENGTH=81 /DNA_ID=CAMNT_0043788507 /DNA_START=42 /DNA_END=287 /DNA_ORIENTATION=+